MKSKRSGKRSAPTHSPRGRVGDRLVRELSEVRDALAEDEPIEKRMTVRTISVHEPGEYSAQDVQHLRHRLGVSQAIFAKLIGVSSELVQHWEQGITSPRATARCLMDEIGRDPERFARRSLSPVRAAG